MSKEMNLVLLYFVLKYNGDFDKVYNALEKKESINRDEYIK